MDIINVAEQLKNDLNKKQLSLKPPKNNGLLLDLHHTIDKKSIRFIHCDFQSNGNILALANTDAQIYIIDFLTRKYWMLKKLDSCTCIRLSDSSDGQLLVGKANGVLNLINTESGDDIAKLLGHEYPVISISFARSDICISASKSEALIWDLNSFCKLQVLSMEKDCAIKFASFVPISNHILICYQDDIIQIWQNGSFKSLKQFHPSNWKNYSVRSITFTRNGKVMVVSGYLPVLAVFQLDLWKLLKIVSLPEYINTVKKIQFIPQNFDGGSNKLLAILSGNGIIYFYNIEDNVVMSELKSKTQISKFNISSSNVHYISCLLSSGEVEIYDISSYIMKNDVTVEEQAQQTFGKGDAKPRSRYFCRKADLKTKIQIENILEIDKLKSIITEYQEFPKAFRATIWERALRLPNNIQQYNCIVNHVTVTAFDDLYRQFPLEDQTCIRCLRHLLNNVVTWCQFFAHVTYLPYFLFPFAKVFHKKPVACFELCCTIIINWCQHWFEYYPLPPVNILAIIDNVLMEHDIDLLKYFSENDMKPVLYSWSVLETAFSEVLTCNEWLQFWDHVLINEPAFLLCAVAAYNILQKKHLMILKRKEEFYQFYHNLRPIDVKKLIGKTYQVFNGTSEKNHPRQYLSMFVSLTSGPYPIFDEYPKDVVNFQVEHVNFLENQLKDINDLKENLVREQCARSTYSDIDIQNEEQRRMIEVEKACIQKIKSYQEALKTQQDQLKTMRAELVKQEKKIINKTRKNVKKHNTRTMEVLMEGLDMSEKINETEIRKLEETYKQQQFDLMKKEKELKKHLQGKGPNPALGDELLLAHKNHTQLKDQIEKAKMDLQAPNRTNVTLLLSTMNKLIEEIQLELQREQNSFDCNNVKGNIKVQQLEKETKSLQKEVSQLLLLINNNRDSDSSSASSSQENIFCNNATNTNDGNNKTVRFSASEC